MRAPSIDARLPPRHILAGSIGEHSRVYKQPRLRGSRQLNHECNGQYLAHRTGRGASPSRTLQRADRGAPYPTEPPTSQPSDNYRITPNMPDQALSQEKECRRRNDTTR